MEFKQSEAIKLASQFRTLSLLADKLNDACKEERGLVEVRISMMKHQTKEKKEIVFSVYDGIMWTPSYGTFEECKKHLESQF